MSKIKYKSILIVSLVYFSCEAPRDNPLDPDAENYRSIEGYVQTFSLPYLPLAGVSVSWAPSGAFVMTDTTGRFLIPNASSSEGYVVFQKTGYRTDSLYVTWGSTRNLALQVSMNRIPVLDSSSIYSTVINYSDNTSSFDLTAKVKITDEDKDIDSVIIENKKLGLRKALEFDMLNKVYQVSIGPGELAINNIEETIGEDFIFDVVDISGILYQVGKDRVTRIIRTGANPVSPDSNSTTDPVPLLTWKKFSPGYPLTYSVELYKSDPVNPQLMFRSSGINMDSTSVRVRTTLTPADYFWIIWTTDSFTNSSRSKPALFNVR